MGSRDRWVGFGGVACCLAAAFWGGWERMRVQSEFPKGYLPFHRYSDWPNVLLLIGILLLGIWLVLRNDSRRILR
jgi:hypothetical protein